MEQTTLSLWKNYWTWKQSYFFRIIWVAASEYTPLDKNIFKVNNKGMFQECYSGVFIITLDNGFEVCKKV